MPLSSQEDESSKLPSDVAKFLQKLIEIACAARCHGLSSSSSPDDPSLYSGDLDNEQVVILEIIQSRARSMMKAKKTIQPRDQSAFAAWAAPGEVHGASTEKTVDGKDGTESEAFFTVGSCLSYCSSSRATGRPSKFEFTGSSVLEGFRHCRGWPLGLYHKALALPPLPSSPEDSWMWHKRNLARQ